VKSKLKTWLKNMDKHGGSVACLSYTLESADPSLIDRVSSAIRNALADEIVVEQKAGALGFHAAEE
jgi:hypothetical protein